MIKAILSLFLWWPIQGSNRQQGKVQGRRGGWPKQLSLCWDSQHTWRKDGIGCVLPTQISSPFSLPLTAYRHPWGLLKGNRSQGVKEIGRANQIALGRKLVGPVETIHGRLWMLACKEGWVSVRASLPLEMENVYDFWSCQVYFYVRTVLALGCACI